MKYFFSLIIALCFVGCNKYEFDPSSLSGTLEVNIEELNGSYALNVYALESYTTNQISDTPVFTQFPAQKHHFEISLNPDNYVVKYGNKGYTIQIQAGKTHKVDF
jgi:hypothetical protein